MGIMRFPSLRAHRSSFSVEGRRKDKKMRDIEIVEWDGEGGFNITLPNDERFGSLKKAESGIDHFRRILSLGRSWSKTSSYRRHEDRSEHSQNITECPKSSSQESVSLTHCFYEYHTNATERGEVAQLVLSRLMSVDDASTGPVPINQDGNDSGCSEVVEVNAQQDRYGVPVLSNTEDDSVTLNTLHYRMNSFDDTVFDGIVDDTIVVDTFVDATNQGQSTAQTSARSRYSSRGKKASSDELFLTSIIVTCCRMPAAKTSIPFSPGSGTVVWDDTVILSALSY
jgi:hypothetical protein